MADIVIKHNDEDVTLEFKFYSPLQFYYKVTVKDNNTGDEIFHGEGKWNGKTNFTLGKPSILIDNLLCIEWTIIDPIDGKHDFNAEAIVLQNGIECQAHQTCTGKTNDSAVNTSTTGTFILGA